MIVEERDGKFYAVHPFHMSVVAKGKGNEIECEVDEKLVKSLRLKYVVDYDPNFDSLKYSDDFYAALYKEIETGKSDTEAYGALGFEVDVLGRNRATNACKKAREKARLAASLKALPPEPGDVAPGLEQYKGTRYVRLISGNKIYYTEEFYETMSGLLEDGVPPVEAYESLGFKTGILGTQRAYKAADHAREWRKKQLEGPVYKVGDFSGAIPLAKMIDEAGYPESTSEWTARLMGRVIYLETILEELKKKM